MGLDMYVRAKRYLSDYNTADKIIKDMVNSSFTDLERGNIDINMVVGEAAYWRKANAIHKWFVENVQDNEDDCGEYYLDREHIKDLIEICKTVLNDRSKAVELLPTQSGFFFGDTNYDEYYFDDLQDAINQLEPLLNSNYDKWEFYYHSSW